MDSKLLTTTLTLSQPLHLPITPITLTSFYPTESSTEPSLINNKIFSCSSEEGFDIDYSCPKCRNPRINDHWCKYCESKRLCENFPNWTSNNEILDEFIRDTQINATKHQDYFVWIDYDKLEDVIYLAKGGFSEVYYGVWVEDSGKII
jgi:hypothetical protein